MARRMGQKNEQKLALENIIPTLKTLEAIKGKYQKFPPGQF